jgi:nucleoside-diphosphate-sugar epimerase
MSNDTTLLPANSAIFVTGGSGFLGRQLIRDLRAQGYTVRALARSDAAASTVRQLGAEPVRGDLGDVDAMRQGMQGCAAIIHSAAHVAMWGRWQDFVRDTVTGTENVLAAARAAGVPRFVHIGTEAVLADGKAIVDADETRPLPAHPNGYYPHSKGIAEQRVIAANGNGLTTMVMRPRFIWGTGDTTLLPQFVQAMQGGQWMWFDGGRHRTSICHVRNVTHGTILAAQNGRGGQIYFLTDGEPVEFRDFISRLVQTWGVTPPTRTAPLWVADLVAAVSELAWKLLPLRGQPTLTRTAVNLMFREVTVRDRKAREELGYRPVVSVDEGLKELAREHAGQKAV